MVEVSDTTVLCTLLYMGEFQCCTALCHTGTSAWVTLRDMGVRDIHLSLLTWYDHPKWSGIKQVTSLNLSEMFFLKEQQNNHNFHLIIKLQGVRATLLQSFYIAQSCSVPKRLSDYWSFICCRQLTGELSLVFSALGFLKITRSYIVLCILGIFINKITLHFSSTFSFQS